MYEGFEDLGIKKPDLDDGSDYVDEEEDWDEKLGPDESEEEE